MSIFCSQCGAPAFHRELCAYCMSLGCKGAVPQDFTVSVKFNPSTPANGFQKWKYIGLHIPTRVEKEDTTHCEMSSLQFLSALAWWNTIGQGNWLYWPVSNQPGILGQHECRNVLD